MNVDATRGPTPDTRPISVPERRPVSRILYVSVGSPVPSKLGPARRNFHIIEQLARFYDVSLLSLGSASDAALCSEAFGDRVRVEYFAEHQLRYYRKFLWKAWRTATNRCDFVPVFEPGLRRYCQQMVRGEPFDAVVLSSVFLAGLPLPVAIPVVGDTHNVEFDMLRRTGTSADSWVRRQYARRQGRATWREEHQASRAVDLLLATSDRDGRIFQNEMGVADVDVVPNGIDLKEFTLASHAGKTGVILFSGLMSYYPNQQAVRWFMDRVFPSVLAHMPAARLVVAGAAPPPWLVERSGPQVHVTGRVPDMRPYLEEASVVVAPLLIGGGTRVKILEAQATGRPVVSTSIGAEGLQVRHRDSIWIADDAESFADGIVELLSDASLAARVAAGGRRYVCQHHDWDRIGDRLGELLRARRALPPRCDAVLRLRPETQHAGTRGLPAFSSERALPPAQTRAEPLRHLHVVRPDCRTHSDRQAWGDG